MDGVTVLVVDDNPGDRRFIQESLENSCSNIDIYTTKTKEDALDFLINQREPTDFPRPDVFLLDWSLSKETSGKLLDVAKSSEPPIPVVIMTGIDPERYKEDSTDQSADLFVQKPTKSEEYIEILHSVLSEK